MMGKYVVRYKGKTVKGMPKGKMMMEPEDMEEDMAPEEEPEEEKSKKGKPFQPEKKIVENMVGKPAKKSKKETGEKGNAKSGNYGHAGIPGHQGGSRPKGSGGTGGGPVAAAPKSATGEHDIYKNLPKGKVPSDYAHDPKTGQMIDRDTGKPVDKNFKPIRTAEQAKADYAAAHPESVAAHQAAGKPIKAAPTKNEFAGQEDRMPDGRGPKDYTRDAQGRVIDKPTGKPVDDNFDIISGMGKPKLPAKGEYVKFNGVSGFHSMGTDFTDAKLEKLRANIEKKMGAPIPMSDFQRSRHGFPAFTWYSDGEESGGG